MASNKQESKQAVKVSFRKETKVHDVLTYNVENLEAFPPKVEEVMISGMKVPCYRVGFYTWNQDDETHERLSSRGDLVLKFPKMFSFGVQECREQGKDGVQGAVTGYSVPLCLFDRDGKTEENEVVLKKLEAIIQRAKELVVDYANKKMIGKKSSEYTDVRDLRCLDKLVYWSLDDEGKVKEGTGPTITPKLVSFKKKDQSAPKSGDSFFDAKNNLLVNSIFYLEDEVDEFGEPKVVNPLEYITTKTVKNYIKITPLIRVESIFIGSKVSIQLKVPEADVEPMKSTSSRLLHKKNIKYGELMATKSTPPNALLSEASAPNPNPVVVQPCENELEVEPVKQEPEHKEEAPKRRTKKSKE